MKNKNIIKSKIIFLFVLCVLFSCTKRGIIERDFNDPVLYMPQGVNAAQGTGLYMVKPNIYNQPVYFTVAGGKINIPVGVIRTGVDLSGDAPVSFVLNTDTIATLRAKGIIDANTIDIPATAYTLPAATTVKDGQTNATSDLIVDLNFLINSFLNTPSRKYVLAIKLASSVSQSQQKSTTLFIIDPNQIIKPTADLFSYTYNDGTKAGSVVNKSSNAVSYTWNFGDGTPVVTDASPAPHKYAAAGTYTITLTAKGVSDQIPVSTKTQTITIL